MSFNTKILQCLFVATYSEEISVTGLVLRQSMKLDIIRNPLKLISQTAFGVRNCSRCQKQICSPIVQLLVLCRGQVRPVWLAFFEDTSLCAIHAKCVQRCQKTFNQDATHVLERVPSDGKNCILQKNSFSLLVIGSSECQTIFPHMVKRYLPKYMIVRGKIENRNQVLTVFSIFICM